MCRQQGVGGEVSGGVVVVEFWPAMLATLRRLHRRS
jgi:hypothetical protein